MKAVPLSYTETIDFLYTQLPMFSRIGMGAFKKDLTNITALCAALGNPQDKFKSIHVAGTNGKGSVSHSLAAILRQSGYKTGLYTSPHLKDFRERIRINGEMVTKDFVVQFLRENMGLVQKVKPSFFETTVAMAFEWFAKNEVDVAVVEVGLGGRLDSTNIIRPVLSVITNISYDHQQLLGNTLGEIAGEKAGIIKPGIPVVIGETHPETEGVFLERARVCQSPVTFADQTQVIIRQSEKNDHLDFEVSDKQGSVSARHFETDLSGPYEHKNLLTVLEAVRQLKLQHWHISGENLCRALVSVKKMTGLRGRWDILGHHPLIVADVAHNIGGITEVVNRLKTISYKNLHIVTGFVKDKPLDKVLAAYPKEAEYYFCNAPIQRALPAAELAVLAGEYRLKGKIFKSVQEAFQTAKANASPDDMVLVCGSVFVVGEVL